jgi:hypothetical protein
MKNITISAIIGLLFVMPLMIMEWVNRREFAESYPFTIFIVLWLLSALFFLILMSIIKDIQSGEGFFRNPLVLIKMILLILLAITWGWILLDQMPCFLGVPHCD